MTPVTDIAQVKGAVQDRKEVGSQARSLIERLLSNGQARLDAELARLRSLEVIDEQGKLINEEPPADMTPGADRDFGG